MRNERLQLWSDDELRQLACDEFQSGTGRQAASVLLERYHARVYQWCNAQLQDPDKASDVAQDVLLKAYHGLSSFAGRSRFSSWLFAITRNRCLDELRRPRLFADEENIDDLADPAATPAVEFEAKATRDEWKALLTKHLEAVEQEAMVLRYFECMPIVDITNTLGIGNPSGARGVLQRAKRKLRAALAGKEHFGDD